MYGTTQARYRAVAHGLGSRPDQHCLIDSVEGNAPTAAQPKATGVELSKVVSRNVYGRDGSNQESSEAPRSRPMWHLPEATLVSGV